MNTTQSQRAGEASGNGKEVAPGAGAPFPPPGGQVASFQVKTQLRVFWNDSLTDWSGWICPYASSEKDASSDEVGVALGQGATPVWQFLYAKSLLMLGCFPFGGGANRMLPCG
jgi:hypothetical protein